MANYCITKYWVGGEQTVLAKLASLIGEGRDVTEILPELGMPFSELSFREDAAAGGDSAAGRIQENDVKDRHGHHAG